MSHYYSYGHLYPNNGSKIVARSTTQDRMTQSAEYFLAGFFGLQWPANASLGRAVYNTTAGATKYIHFVLNQRTVPLHASFPECEVRDDGWCELETFMKVQATKLEEAGYEWACWGDYEPVPYGTITDGVPVARPSGGLAGEL